MKYKNFWEIYVIENGERVIQFLHRGNNPERTARYKQLARFNEVGYCVITERQYCNSAGLYYPFRMKTTKAQASFLHKAFLEWSNVFGDNEYKKSFGVVTKVLENGYYVEQQRPYLDNVREWYIHTIQKK